MTESTATTDPLPMLVGQLLIAGSEGLAAPQLAAFVAGWSAALELVERTDLLVPGANPEFHAAMADLVRRIRDAQRSVLADDDEV